MILFSNGPESGIFPLSKEATCGINFESIVEEALIKTGGKSKFTWISLISSLRLGMTLLAIIGAAALLGTLIPQQFSAREVFLHRHPMTGAIFQKLGLFDLYHSFWFLALEGLLALNLIACTLNRLPVLWRRFKGPIDPNPDYPPDRTTSLRASLEEATGRIVTVLRDRYGKTAGELRWTPAGKDSGDAGSRVAVVRRNAFSHLGVPVVHLGVLIILAGALAGAWFGFEGDMMIPQGEALQTVKLKEGGERDLGFQVRCDRFTAEFYDSGAPREYRSDLSFLKNGQVAEKAVLRVNEPAVFEGIRFYQASYGSIPDSFVLGIAGGRERQRTIRLKAGESFTLKEAQATVSVLRAEENLMGFGPGIKLMVETPRGETEFWVFKNIDVLTRENPGMLERAPLLNPGRFKPYRFSLQEMESRPYTGLMVSRDPAFPFVFAGFVIVVTGCIALYLFPPRLIKISAGPAGAPAGRPGDGGVRVGVTGRWGRSKEASDREVNAILDNLKEEEARSA